MTARRRGRAGRGRELSEPLLEAAPGMVEEPMALLGQRRPEGTTTRILFAIVLGKERRMEEYS